MILGSAVTRIAARILAPACSAVPNSHSKIGIISLDESFRVLVGSLCKSVDRIVLAIGCYVYSAFICQIAHRPKPKRYNLFVDGIELAQWRNSENRFPQDAYLSLEGTPSGDQLAETMSLDFA